MSELAMARMPAPSFSSDTQIRRLKDFQSLLNFRAEKADGFARQTILAQAEKVNQNIERCCGKKSFKYENFQKNINDNI
jgi:hypothetical protein